MKFLNIDSPFMQGLGKMADLMIINLLTIVCCIPVFTIGASLTAMNYMALKIVRDEECYVIKGFFKSFKENFKQSTAIWLIFLVVGLILGGDFYIMKNSGIEMHNVVQTLIFVAAFLVLFAFVFVFPVQAKFENTVLRTIKNAFLISVMQFPKTILMIILYAGAVLLFFTVPQAMPIVFLFGLSVPAWVGAKTYNKFFQKLEDQIMAESAPAEEEVAGEDERIFKDEADPELEQNDNIQ